MKSLKTLGASMLLSLVLCGITFSLLFAGLWIIQSFGFAGVFISFVVVFGILFFLSGELDE